MQERIKEQWAEIPFHDAILSRVACDLEAGTANVRVSNEADDGIEYGYEILFKGVEKCSLVNLDLFSVEEVSQVLLSDSGDGYAAEIICLLGFGKPTGSIHLFFRDLEVNKSKV